MKYMCHISLNIRIAYAHIVNSYEAIYETYMLLVCKTHATYKASYMSRTCKHTFNIYATYEEDTWQHISHNTSIIHDNI